MRPALFLDTNLLILLVVGRVDPVLIDDHRRLSAYARSDFLVLTRIFNGFDVLQTTPNILTETSNLLGRRMDPVGLQIQAMFRYLVQLSAEIVVPSVEATALPAFDRLGLADAATLAALSDHSVLLTDDGPLFVAACHAKRKAELFSAYR